MRTITDTLPPICVIPSIIFPPTIGVCSVSMSILCLSPPPQSSHSSIPSFPITVAGPSFPIIAYFPIIVYSPIIAYFPIVIYFIIVYFPIIVYFIIPLSVIPPLSVIVLPFAILFINP